MTSWAVPARVASSFWVTLRLAYTHGGINLEGWQFSGQPTRVFNFLTDKLRNPVDLNVTLGRCTFMAIGTAIMWLLMFLRHRFVWWPLHYLGYPVCDSYIVSCVWFGIFLGWLVKSVILKYGGSTLGRHGCAVGCSNQEAVTTRIALSESICSCLV